jgi:hypothetical protein
LWSLLVLLSLYGVFAASFFSLFFLGLLWRFFAFFLLFGWFSVVFMFVLFVLVVCLWWLFFCLLVLVLAGVVFLVLSGSSFAALLYVFAATIPPLAYLMPWFRGFNIFAISKKNYVTLCWLSVLFLIKC